MELRAEIEGMKVVEEVKYLGVMVQSKRNLYEKQRIEMISKARQMSALTHTVIARSCHKVLIGKAYWKGVAIPRILFAAEVVNLRRVDRDSIQVQENGAMRRMLDAPRGVAVAGMRGEIGIGTVESRVARGRVQYLHEKDRTRRQ